MPLTRSIKMAKLFSFRKTLPALSDYRLDATAAKTIADVMRM